ncbi:MAG TPA: hypothetical protein VF176_10015 [Solirubrobacterales bacterium]
MTGQAPLRSALTNAAWAIEDRVVWGGADILRGVVDVIKWPFERIAWAAERWLIWPVAERAAEWSPAARTGAALLAVAAVIGAGAAGVIWASGGQDDEAPVSTQAGGLMGLLSTQPTPEPTSGGAKPALQGAAPIFKPEADGGVVAGGVGNATATNSKSTAAATPATATTTTRAAAATTAPGGPAALAVAKRFANAFVLYEIGEGDKRVRSVFHETATPELARSLLRRPPRLPENIKVPKAKVLNVVPGPRLGGTFTVSASLLRVGVTSELRIDLQKTKQGTRVTSVLG